MKNPYSIKLFLSVLIILLQAPAVDAYTHNNDRISRESIHETLGLLKELDKDEGLLHDYILYLSALKHNYSANNIDALKEIDRFVSLYPGSLLSKDMGLLRIEILYDLSKDVNPPKEEGRNSEPDIYLHPEKRREELLRSLKAYTDEYPDDEKGLYLYAVVLKDSGMQPEAARIFKRLYINGGGYYTEAKKEMSIDGLTVREILKLNKNILKSMRYEDSEGLLLETLKRKDPAYRKELYEALGDTYFRMKEYPRAAGYYMKGKNYYQAAVSHYRAGNYSSFEDVIKRMGEEKSEDTCRLLILKGLRQRREGDFEGALGIFRGVYMNGYPCKEDALWNIGWAEYLMGNFMSASYNFRDLYGTYGDPKYLYWQARAGERLGEDVSMLYSRIDDDSFYAVLSHLRGDGFRMMPIHTELRSYQAITDEEASKQDAHGRASSESLDRIIRRAELLGRVGLNRYAVMELMSYAAGDGDEKLKICSRLQMLGAYDKSVRCAYSLKGYDNIAPLLYPYAYKEVVGRTASENGIDPLLILSVMREESGFREDAFSVAGAVGLMQLMPYTAQRMAGFLQFEGSIDSHTDLVPAEVNIALGSRYLKQLVDEFGALPYAIAAYNAGKTAVRKWINAYEYRDIDEFIEDIPYRETKGYVKRVLKTYFRYRTLGNTGS